MLSESSGRTQPPSRRETSGLERVYSEDPRTSRARADFSAKSSVRAVKLVLAYDGSDFSGWQRQKNGRSVQEELEKALAKMHGHEIRVTGAGRTDAGVHAMGQVAGFYTDIKSIAADRFVFALNKLMPRDVRVLSSEEAPPDFHARFDASLRRYRYFLLCGGTPDPFALRYAHSLSYYPRVAVLNAMAAVVLGEHDFSTFASAQDASESRSRHISESIFFFERERLVYQVAGNAFLWRQVRSLVGTFLELERIAESSAHGEALMREMLESRDRGRAGTTAPACGLFLWNVEYGERIHGHTRRRGGAEGSGGRRSESSESKDTRARTTEAEPNPASGGSRLVPGLGWIDEGE
ncbi:MAG: tRNA pseudouridine(38-40) synthase TruA [Rectinema sp.]